MLVPLDWTLPFIYFDSIVMLFKSFFAWLLILLCVTP